MHATMFTNRKRFEVRLAGPFEREDGTTGHHVEIYTPNGSDSVTLVGTTAEILDLCERIQQLQQEIMRQEATCQETVI